MTDELKTFRDLQFQLNDTCERARMDFANDFGVSVIRGEGTIGGTKGLWEVAVMKNGWIDYDTPVTDNVIGSCTEEDVTRIMKQVQELNPQEDNQ